MAVVSYIENIASTAVISPRFSSASESAQLFEGVSSTATSPYDLPREIRVSENDFRLFLVAVDQGAKQPNDRLKRAAENYKNKYR